MNKSSKTDVLHRLSLSGLRTLKVYMELSRIFTMKEMLAIKYTGCAVHMCMHFYQKSC